MLDLNVEIGTSRDRLVVQSSRVASSVFLILSPTHKTCWILTHRNHEVTISTETPLSIPLLNRHLPPPLFSQLLSIERLFKYLILLCIHLLLKFALVIYQ